MFEYSPFSRKQLQVIGAQLARINILDGSVRSGKTISSIIRWMLYVGNECPESAKLLMIGVTIDTLKRNVIDPLILIVGEQHARYIEGTLWLFGREIHCVGANDVRAENRIRGMTVWGCYVDEATLIPEPVLKQSLLRCSAGKGCSIWTTNPDGPFHWIHLDYIERLASLNGSVNYWHFTLKDNLSLSQEYKGHLTGSFKGLFYRRFVLGLWCLAEGLIYDSFDLDKFGFDDDALKFDHYDLTIDYGTQNPFAALKVGQVGARSHVFDEYYYSGKDSQKQKTDAEYSADLKKFIANEKTPPRRVIIDPSAASLKAQLARDGWRYITDADNDVLPGIGTVSTRLGTGQLLIHRRKCPNLVKEFGSYSWDSKAATKGEDKPIKKFDHCFIAGTMVETITGPKPIESIAIGDLVLTRNGYRPVLMQGMTNESADVMTVGFSNGTTLTGTGGHPVWVRGKGFIDLNALRYGDIMEVCENQKPSYSTGLPSIGILNLKTGPIASIIGHTLSISRQALTHFTGKSGKILTAKFQTDITSTIKTSTRSITQSQIWSAFRHLSTVNAIQLILQSGHHRLNIWNTLQGFDHLQRNGTVAMKESLGTANMANGHGMTGSRLEKRVSSAAKTMDRWAEGKLTAFAPIIANQNGVESTALMMNSVNASFAPNCSRLIATFQRVLVLMNVSDRLCGSVTMSVRHASLAALSVTKNLKPEAQNRTLSDSAQKNVQVTIGPKPQGKAPVYNLTVDQDPEYFANGVLVHNCLDALRYHQHSLYGKPRQIVRGHSG